MPFPFFGSAQVKMNEQVLHGVTPFELSIAVDRGWRQIGGHGAAGSDRDPD
jgi:hypothetical protein